MGLYLFFMGLVYFFLILKIYFTYKFINSNIKILKKIVFLVFLKFRSSFHEFNKLFIEFVIKSKMSAKYKN